MRTNNPKGHVESLRPWIQPGTPQTQQRCARTAETKRRKTEQEWGLPYEQAKKVREKYYQKGYMRAKTYYMELVAHLQEQLANAQSQRVA